MSPAQCRAARAWLRWKQPVLAERAGICAETIKRFEQSAHKRAAHDTSVEKIAAAFAAAGVTFIFKDGNALGVQVAPR